MRPRRARRVPAGGRVRLRPRGRPTSWIWPWPGWTATIEAIEQDFEGRIYLAVTVDDDPGSDLGMLPPARTPLLLPSRTKWNPFREAVPRCRVTDWNPGGVDSRCRRSRPGCSRFLGHSPTFAVRELPGDLVFDGGEIELALDLIVDAASLELEDRVKDSDREEIEERMRRDVLERRRRIREIALPATERSPCDESRRGRYRLRIDGRLSLHGVTRPHRVEAELLDLRGRPPPARRMRRCGCPTTGSSR